MKFKSVSSQIDFIKLEKELLEYWYKQGIVDKYLARNNASSKKFSFLDGPITANNPMGVHHAWGRTYKDLWQRFFNMRGYAQRFQNGFDEQGLWVEVEVEKELGLKSKKDIENLVTGNKYASLEKFINLCKDRVKKYSAIQTEQSKRLGYFMDWDNSYHTSSDKNNYEIWHFLKVVNEKGWLYKGRDSVPWCPRCGTAISQHEILTEEYKELTHTAVYFKLPIVGKDHEYLLVWTTTPWTIPANIAVAVNDTQLYSGYSFDGVKIWVGDKILSKLIDQEVLPKDGSRVEGKTGSELVGWEYLAPFDNLDRVKTALNGYSHRVVAGDDRILPVTMEDGTGLVHIATGAGSEDFQLGRKEKLPVIDVIDESAVYLEGLGELTGKNAKDDPGVVITYLQNQANGGFLQQVHPHTHRYPICWRCRKELVWRVVDEWYISMDKPDQSGKTYREQMVEVARKIHWMPSWGLDRELDWLKNMHDWLISKKRYWGLALPIWECPKCGNFEVVGSIEELEEKATEGWKEFDGHSPHRPWIDQVKVKCAKCHEASSRVPDVGNPWLDAGIVPFSTLPEGWFPADFITESFPGQFKNWFYSLIAMSTAISSENPFKNILGYATVRDEKGEEMHKSKGNSIEFNEAADKIGVDVMRWLYASQNPEYNLNFGFNVTDEVRRRFYLILWNSYKFFIDYATGTSWSCSHTPEDIQDKLTVLDKWILARLTETVLLVNSKMETFVTYEAAKAIEDFVVNDLSTWYIRRSRDRVGPQADKMQQDVFLSTLYGVLVAISKLLAPFTPFISEEMFKNLTGEVSVHLSDYPLGDKSLLNNKLINDMQLVRKVVKLGHESRKQASIKLRQPLSKLNYYSEDKLGQDLESIAKEELNIKDIEHKKYSDQLKVEMDTKITPELKEEGEARELVRAIQSLRKEAGLTFNDQIKVFLPVPPSKPEYMDFLMKQTNAREIQKADDLNIEVLDV